MLIAYLCQITFTTFPVKLYRWLGNSLSFQHFEKNRYLADILKSWFIWPTMIGETETLTTVFKEIKKENTSFGMVVRVPRTFLNGVQCALDK